MKKYSNVGFQGKKTTAKMRNYLSFQTHKDVMEGWIE